MKVIKKEIKGNYEMNLEVAALRPGESVKVFFSANEDMSTYAFMKIAGGGFKLGRVMGGKTDVWKEYSGVNSLPWKIRVLKKGNFFRFRVNEVSGWMHSPLGFWDDESDDSLQEPMEAYVGVEFPEGAKIDSCKTTTLPWLQELTKPVIEHGKGGSWYAKQVLPGGIIERDGVYYMYFTGSNPDVLSDPPVGAQIGVAYSKDLKNWTVHPKPVIGIGKAGSGESLAVYSNGAVVTPEGKIAVMYSGQYDGTDGENKWGVWGGFYVATADSPLGPFEKCKSNPVYKHEYFSAHEFDLVRVDHPDYSYILFYSGFNPNPPTGPAGDRGYLVYSNDLVNWTSDERNPVFHPETLDNWDAIHIRPRSLNRIADTWYLWYEGCNQWTPPTRSDYHGWWDTVGLARSKDLVSWEYYPCNPALPGLGNSTKQFDNRWVGWPRMLVKDGIGYVFYVGADGHSIGCRKIAIDKLTNWKTEGGETIDILSEAGRK